MSLPGGKLQPAKGPDGLVLTHGAGGNADSALLLAVANAFVEAGVTVLRYDLPFRQNRRSGAPSPANAAADRDGLRQAAEFLRSRVKGRVFLGGQSYGGRMASMLLASDASAADGLLLLSYPLHPPGQPAKLRTAHLPNLRVPVHFVHGTRDPFGSIEEIETARTLIPGPTSLSVVDGAGHDLKKGKFDIADLAVRPLLHPQRL
jgi:hypothetical protein